MLTIKRLGLADARLLIEGAARKADEIGIPMCIAITDESGNLIAFERMDGGKITSVTIAQDKSFTASAAKKATHDYNAANVPGSLAFGIHTEVGCRISSVGGGLPVIVEGEVVGGIGISSGTPQQDMDCAQAGIDYFMNQRS
ncbi:GlcG/HbpS family heme-binding protein [Marinobacter salicampi]|uniref:GlcG/HbpS family heme-binding protein n=1 Tax=Marinobacter salicampi TaxID=435907 RepID=UPI00140E136B|nr:heme-binding protein [Marinobacter salicampi]